ncbi:MAG: hypothetical protein A2X78_03820 [Gammaproteobacteria bacterium GWE2_37_16]|nr:MAG: hypothetical protein A2X78_03820 [Gammaproteobacteria bacterium GWE2_37_16]
MIDFKGRHFDKTLSALISRCLALNFLQPLKATITGIELHHLFIKGQMICSSNMPVWEQFYALAG